MPILEQTGDTYQSSQYAKALAIAEGKVGKTTFEVASLLGVLPWQKEGGVVTKPEHLHILTFDANAGGGLKKFIKETCNAPDEALKFRIYNLQDTMRRVSEGDGDYDMAFYNDVLSAISMVSDRVRPGEVHAIVFSSLTGLAAGFERALIGPPKGRGYSDPSKWKALSHQLSEVQNYAQVDKWHTIWEAHLDKPASMGMGKGGDSEAPKESIRVSGSAGRNWAYNVEQVFRIRRQFGRVHPGTKCDMVCLDTRPSFEFISGGRNFTEALEPNEYDMTAVFRKLGLKVGNWGAKSAKPVAKPAAPVRRPAP